MTRHTGKQSIEQDVEVAVTCDRCARTFQTSLDDFEIQEMLRVSTYGGYGSIFGDQNKIDLDLCQQCLDEVLGPFLRITPAD